MCVCGGGGGGGGLSTCVIIHCLSVSCKHAHRSCSALVI